MKAYLIHPVTGHKLNEINPIVRAIEACGIDLYVPMRDTRQDSSILDICWLNRRAIEEAEVCFIVWDGESYGCMFDLGIAYALKKRVVMVSSPDSRKGSQSWAEFVKRYCVDKVKSDVS